MTVADRWKKYSTYTNHVYKNSKEAAVKKLILAALLALMVPVAVHGENVITSAGKTVGKKIADPDWLSRKVLKYGFVVAVTSTNALRMAREADEFDDRDLLGTNSHHLVDLGIVAGLITSGYMLYAIVDRDSWDWKDRVSLITGTLAIAREAGEFTYQGMRHGDPFNNNPDWHRSELTWFTSAAKCPWVQDRMIATGQKATPALHIGFSAVGFNLIGRVK